MNSTLAEWNKKIAEQVVVGKLSAVERNDVLNTERTCNSRVVSPSGEKSSFGMTVLIPGSFLCWSLILRKSRWWTEQPCCGNRVTGPRVLVLTG